MNYRERHVRKKVFLITLSLFLLMSCSDQAARLKQEKLIECKQHFRAESFKVARQVCQEAAELDVVQAQWLLGHIYYFDMAGVEKKREKRTVITTDVETGEVTVSMDEQTEVKALKAKGFSWYLKAAQGGWPEAATYVGESYLYGDGVDIDYGKALVWLTKAAQHRDVNAEFSLGLLYYNGYGQDKNLTMAMEWFAKAATKKHAMGMNNLAWIYATSYSSDIRNPEKALYWAEQLDISSTDRATFLDTKAAAYATASQFDVAITLQNQAISSLPENFDNERLLDFETRLESYQKEIAWLEKE